MTTRMPCWACEGTGSIVGAPGENCGGTGWTVIGRRVESMDPRERAILHFDEEGEKE